MFRLLSQQAFKARPFRLSNGTASRWIHSVRLPYTGLPSYDMITRRFFSEVDPQAYFTRKREQEASDRGEYVDIHDINPEQGFYPSDFDVLLTDITHQTLESTISEELGIPYLAKAAEDEVKKVVQVSDGYIYGANKRTIVPLVLSYEQEARWGFFIVDSGSPWTFISRQAGKIFGIKEDSNMETLVTIGGYPKEIRLSPLRSHFHDVSLLGTDFCQLHSVQAWYDYMRRRATLYFGGKWKVVKDAESKL